MALVLIRQFDVYANPERRSRLQIPFVIILQSDHIHDTRGLVVAPLVDAETA